MVPGWMKLAANSVGVGLGQKGEDSMIKVFLSTMIRLLAKSCIILFLSINGRPHKMEELSNFATYPMKHQECGPLVAVNLTRPTTSRGDWPSAWLGKESVWSSFSIERPSL